MGQGIVTLSIYFVFYVLAGYRWWNILRLTRGAVADINASSCYCPICGYKIRLTDQIPMISYLCSGGKCRSCHSKIPPNELLLECAVFGLMSVTATCLRFSLAGYLLCLFLYEAVKCGCLLVLGRRPERFAHNLAISLRNNLVLWGLIGLLFALRCIADLSP